MTIALRPYQTEALEAANKPGRQLIVLPTGTGKTVVFAELIRKRGGTALILAHRDELLEQAAEKIRTVAPELGLSLGFVKAGRDETNAPIVIASVQTLARSKRRGRLPGRFDTVVVDEAHHAAATSYRAILAHVADSPVVLGFTATPERTDKGRLSDVFDGIAYQRSLLSMIEDGYLCDLRGVRVELDLDLSDVDRSLGGRGDFQAEDLGEALDAADASDRAVDAWREHADGRRGLIFCPTIAVSEGMAASFAGAGYRAAHLDGTTPRDRRREILRQLRAGDLDVVSNVGVLTEGFDEPSIDAIVVARPTRSRVLYSQMIGRGTRLHPGKSDCLIVDLVGVSDELEVETLPAVFGIEEVREDETATEAVDRTERERAAAQRTQQERIAAERRRKAKLKARRFGVFSRDRIHWHKMGRRFAVDVGAGEQIVLDPQGETWRVLVVRESGANVVREGLDLGYAQGTAEEVIRSRGKAALADREAAWRDHPATTGQIRRAASIGVALPADPTKGQAADAITQWIVRRRIQQLEKAEAARAAAQPERSAA